MNEQELIAGTVEGTGATLNINVGFMPSAVKVFNVDGLATLEWNDSMADASGVKRVTAGTMTFITTLGITPVDGLGESAGAVEDTVIGFQIGADTDVNVAAETINWEAYR